jgi:hypothetical protein
VVFAGRRAVAVIPTKKRRLDLPVVDCADAGETTTKKPKRRYAVISCPSTPATQAGLVRSQNFDSRRTNKKRRSKPFMPIAQGRSRERLQSSFVGLADPRKLREGIK